MKRTIKQTVKRSLKTKKAFTLVELLVVIAIIGILFVVLISKVDFATDKAKAKGVQTDFRSYQLALKTVGMEQQGFTNDMDDLAAQLNKNLDPKLQVAVVDGKLTTEAEDPWGTEYHIIYSEPENARGKIIITSAGQDRTVGTDDDYNIVIEYAITSTGGSVNIEFIEGHADGVTPQPGPGGEEPIVLAAGIYDAEDNLLADWETLTKPVAEGGLYGMDVAKDYTSSTYKTDTASPYYVLKNHFSDAKKVVIPGSVLSIGDYAFYYNNSLKTIEIRSGAIEIGYESFGRCSALTQIDLPETVTAIGEYAFYECTRLLSIDIPDAVETIGKSTFYSCSSLKSVHLPNNLKTIGICAFNWCEALYDIDIPSGVTSIGANAFEGCYALMEIVIPEGITEIATCTFNCCSALTNVQLPSTLTTINDEAFKFSGIVTITIPENVTTIYSQSFRFCYKLVEVCNKSPLTIVVGDAINVNGGLGYYAKEVIEDESQSRVEIIDDFVFYTGLDDVVYLSAYVGTATDLTLPVYNGGQSYVIGHRAFESHYTITNLVVPNYVTQIKDTVFQYCDNLTTITIQSDSLLAMIGNIFYGSTKLTNIYVPAELVDDYKTAGNWKNHASKIQAIPTT